MPKDVTLSLTRSFDSPSETVETYWFTDTIREYFESILEFAAQGRGQGFWIEAEYGAGKTHFLATLGCLLANTVQVTSTDELLAWNGSLEPDLRAAIERHVKTQTGFSSAEYATGAGRAALAEVIRGYCDLTHIQPRTSATVRDRLVAPGSVFRPGVWCQRRFDIPQNRWFEIPRLGRSVRAVTLQP